MKDDLVLIELRRLITEADSMEDRVCKHQISWNQWEASGRSKAPPDWLIEESDVVMVPFQRLLESLYLTSVCYLDAIGVNVYLAMFLKKFGKRFDSKAASEKFNIDLDSFEYAFNVFLRDLRQFLAPLGVIGDSERYRWLSGVHYLESILKNTAVIIHKLGKSPKSETEVSDSVKFAVEAAFPSSTTARSYFVHTAQEYKPDILIPELFAAVEYKYAENERKLKVTIGQIADDVKGYTGDPRYHLFYAVFYVKNDFWGAEKFNTAWKQKKFPDNWKAFWVVGA